MPSERTGTPGTGIPGSDGRQTDVASRATVLAVGTRAAYLHRPAGILLSRLPDAVARVLGSAVTTRNWATMTKLNAMMAG